jgi:hypothetical protein
MRKLLRTLVACCAAQASRADNEATTWEAIGRSMRELLDDRWIIVAQSTFLAPVENTPGVTIRYNFVLAKDGKHAICMLDNPSVRDGARSNCRYLN